jgi:hypothetical protein
MFFHYGGAAGMVWQSAPFHEPFSTIAMCGSSYECVRVRTVTVVIRQKFGGRRS